MEDWQSGKVYMKALIEDIIAHGTFDSPMPKSGKWNFTLGDTKGSIYIEDGKFIALSCEQVVSYPFWGSGEVGESQRAVNPSSSD